MSPPGLRPEHLADLSRSGLTPEDAATAGCRSLGAEEVSACVGFTVHSAGYLIPYPGNGTVRVRLDEPFRDEDGHRAKYLSPKGAALRLYIPAGVREELVREPERPLYLTEGEKKCLSLKKHLGVSVVGIPGVWCWKSTKRTSGVIEDLETLRPLLRNRSVVIVFDSDARENLQVARAAAGLADWLREKGKARPSWAFPVLGADGGKLGIDDLLVAEGVDAVRKSLDSPIAPQDPGAFIFREVVRRASPGPLAQFVGGPLYESLREVLRAAPQRMRKALADEAKKALKLAASERDALLDGLAR